MNQPELAFFIKNEVSDEEILPDIFLPTQNQQELAVFIKNEVSDEDISPDTSLPTQTAKCESAAEEWDSCSFKVKEEYSIDELQKLDTSTLVDLFTIKECLPKGEIKYKCQMVPGCIRCYTKESENHCKELISAHLLNHVESLVIRSNRNPTMYVDKKIYPCLQKNVKEEVDESTSTNYELSGNVRKLSNSQSSQFLSGTTSDDSFPSNLTPSYQAQFDDIKPSITHEDTESLKTSSTGKSNEFQYNFPTVVMHDSKKRSFSKTAASNSKSNLVLPLPDSVKKIKRSPSISGSSDDNDELSSSGSESESSDDDNVAARSRFFMKQKRNFGSRTLSSTLRNRINFRQSVRRKAVKNDNQEISKVNLNRRNIKKVVSNSAKGQPLCNSASNISPTQNKLLQDHSSTNHTQLNKDSTSGSTASNVSQCNNALSFNSKNQNDTTPFSNAISSSHNSQTKRTSHPTSPLNDSAIILPTTEHSSCSQNLCEPTQSEATVSKAAASAMSGSDLLNNPATPTSSKTLADSARRRCKPSILQRRSPRNKTISKRAGVQAIASSESGETTSTNHPAEEPDREPSLVDEAAVPHAEASSKSVGSRNLESSSNQTSGDAANAKKSRKQDLVKSMKEDNDQQSATDFFRSVRHDHCYTEKIQIWSPCRRNFAGFVKIPLPSRNGHSTPANGKKVSSPQDNDACSSKEEYKLKGPSSKQVEAATDPNIKAKALRLISELRHRKPSEVMVCTERLLVKGKSAFIVQDFYSCEICGKRFTAPNSLYGHYRAHAGIKPYSCKICGQTFTRSHSLAYHGMIHDNTARFECEICKKKFRHPTHFKEHQHRHTGEEPYVCTDCPRRFKTRNTFRRHMLTKHQKKITPMGSLPLNSRIINFIRKPGVARSSGSRTKPDDK